MFANIEKAYQLNPELAESNMSKAFIHFWEGDYNQAFEKYRIALERGPNKYEIHMAVGYAYREMGLYEQAMPFFLKVTELAPFYLYGKFNISWNYLYKGEFDKSEGYLREALALNPRNPFSLLYLARYLLQMGKSDEAGQFLLELERTSPDFFLLPHYQALLYASRGEKAKALELYRDPRVYSLLGMNDEAIQSMTKEISEGTFYSYLRLINDPFYKNLRKDPRFEQIVTQAKKTHEELSKKFGNYF